MTISAPTSPSWLLKDDSGPRPVLARWAPDQGLELLAGDASELTELAGVTVVFDGLLYEREELARVAGVDDEALTNAELVLRAYLRRAAGVLPELRGVFTLAIWDARNDALLCVRDKMGLQPLFYASSGEGLLISASTESLLQTGEVPARVNRVVLAEHLSIRWTTKDETYWTAIRRVPAGHVLELRCGVRNVFRYWHAPPESADDWVREGELELFEDVFTRAVERGLDVGRAGICLSGGLDSISVATVATQRARARGDTDPLALSVEFPDPDGLDEAGIQRSVARQLGIDQWMITLDEAIEHWRTLPAALELSKAMPAPLFGFFSPSYLHMMGRARAEGCDVIMTGGGGDEWLAVAVTWASDLIATGDFRGLYRFYKAIQRSYRVPRKTHVKNMLWTFGSRPLLVTLETRLLDRVAPGLLRAQRRWVVERNTHPWLVPDPELRRELHERAIADRSRPKSPFGRAYVGEIRRAFDHPLVAFELEEMYEKARRSGARVHLPYWDADLAYYLCRVPPKLLNQGDRSKSLARRLLAKRAPELRVEKQRKIVTGNFWPERHKEAAQAWTELGGPQALAEAGIVERDAVDSFVEKTLLRGRGASSHYIRDLLNLEVWLRERL